MNQQDQQAIDELFQHLHASASQAGPRDPQAEARIQQLFQQGPPGLLYQMAQTLVAQQRALNQAKAQIAAQQPDGAPAGFAAGPQAGRAAGYSGQVYQPVYQQQPSGGGFLAGAGKIALGVGGGILAADAISSLFDGGGLFGDDRDYNQTEIVNNNYYEQPDGNHAGFGDQQDYGNQGDYVDQPGYDDQQADFADYDQGDFGDGGW